MKTIKNERKKRKALLIINIRKEYREYYKRFFEEKLSNLEIEQDKRIDDLNHFFEKNLRKQKEGIEKQYRTLLNEKDEKIKELQQKFEDNRKLFEYIKQREQDLNNIITLVGTRFEGFANLVMNGYTSIKNSFDQIDGFKGYNQKHLKNDAKVIEATKE